MSISKAIALNRKNGQHFFDRQTMKYFNSRIESTLRRKEYFITSEQYDESAPRYYTVRKFNWLTGEVQMMGHFQQFRTREEAYAFINQIN